ncbi:hypothetical protein MKY82_23385 [Paenibacillus sp. FSL W7-1279]|uniref:hypothetical protein n=1 Tax=Paenibacillus sp. FSL W7-1279 TaxID=2921697 RepID=UPI0030DA6802
MKIKRFTWLFISALLCLLVVLFGNAMTPKLGTSSGNGNPAILLFIPLSILFLVLVNQWIRVFKDVKMSLISLSLLIFTLAGYIIAGYVYQLRRLEVYRQIQAEAFESEYGKVDWTHIESITSGILSIHMNNQFFNVNTYFMMMAFSLLLCFLYKLIKGFINRSQGTSAEN